jgi:hypothetical protein
LFDEGGLEAARSTSPDRDFAAGTDGREHSARPAAAFEPHPASLISATPAISASRTRFAPKVFVRITWLPAST